MHPKRSSLYLLLPLLMTRCDGGSLTDTLATIAQRFISGVAGPGDPSKLSPINPVPREVFGSANNAEALLYPNAPSAGLALADASDPSSPLNFFTISHTDQQGVGPLFNQRRCVGCHFSSADIKDNALEATLGFTLLNTVNTPVSRAARQGPTDYDYVHDNYRPNTAAFTLFGDFFPATGLFDPISILGGPLQHVMSTGLNLGCISLRLPGFSQDVNLQGGIDPVTGLSGMGAFRAVGERAAPPYIGRGLMEAVPDAELLSNEDVTDQVNATALCNQDGTVPKGVTTCSSLLPEVDHAICTGDCISGRHNEGNAALSMVGGDPLMRVGKLGLRAAGATLLQFDTGGTQGEVGLTSQYFPTEQPNVENVGKACDQVPDPEISAETVSNLRALIRLIGPPDYARELRETPPQSQLATDIQAGAALFGIDLPAFLSRTTQGASPIRPGDPDADRGMAKNRMLNCVACHIPIQKTGQSPAQIGAELLSNKWAPLFSDLLIHAVPSLPQGRPEYLYPDVYGPGGDAGLRSYLDQVFADSFQRPGISHNLADYALPPAVTGLAAGNEFRTPPLMGLGKVGPPFLHDARVYVNVTGKRIADTARALPDGTIPDPSLFPNDHGVDPQAPAAVAAMATTVFTSATGANLPLPVDSVDHALQAAIELHDLPAPPGNDYSKCPPAAPERDVCGRDSRFRSEARNTLEKWRRLTDRQQLQVIRFLESL